MSLALDCVSTSSPHELVADLMVVGLYVSSHSSSPLAALSWLSKEERLALQPCIERKAFSSKCDQSFSFTRWTSEGASSCILLGLGEESSCSSARARLFGAKAARMAQDNKAQNLVLCLPALFDTHIQAIVEGIELGAYRFVKYLTGEKHPKMTLQKVTLAMEGPFPTHGKQDITRGQIIGQSINMTRDLVNEPPNVMTPCALAEEAERMAHRCGLGVQVFDYAEIQRRGMHLIQAVGQGSRNEPRFVHLTYTPKEPPLQKIVFLGKGITFDTGGVSIKPSGGMHEMKADMAGAANMIGLMSAIAALNPPVEVHALMACAENMPDGNAYRPGDIWGSLSGKTVEIINTDAEGRLLLADGLAYAQALKPDVLIDNATLTGACVVALGPSCSGFYATKEDLAEQFAEAANISGETMWRMPLLEDLQDQVKSDIADVKQTGERYGGSITAALFLREFIGETSNWIHVDIAGPAYADKSMGWSSKGATGHGILTFLAFVEQIGKNTMQ